jgi:predicted nucleic acid-binding Zn ribbon protein
MEDWEDPEEADDDEDDQTVACPFCQRPVYEDAERCPGCGQYLSAEDLAQPRRKPWWLVVGALICLVMVLRWVTLGVLP